MSPIEVRYDENHLVAHVEPDGRTKVAKSGITISSGQQVALLCGVVEMLSRSRKIFAENPVSIVVVANNSSAGGVVDGKHVGAGEEVEVSGVKFIGLQARRR